MTRADWNETAKGFAGYVQQFRLFVERGAVPLRFYQSSVTTIDDEGPLVVGIFGNDHDRGSLSDQEIALVRKGLNDAALRELGFGLSSDGSTWALLVEAREHYQTAAGTRFHKELLKISLEDKVWRAWLKANDQAPAA